MEDSSVMVQSASGKDTNHIYLSPVENVFQGELGVVARSEAAAATGIGWTATLVNVTRFNFLDTEIAASKPMTVFIVYRNKHWIVTPGPETSGKLTIGAHTIEVKPGDKQFEVPDDMLRVQ